MQVISQLQRPLAMNKFNSCFISSIKEYYCNFKKINNNYGAFDPPWILKLGNNY